MRLSTLALVVYSLIQVYALTEVASGIDAWSRYSTAGHPKAKGIDLAIEYPSEWRKEEGDRPHVVQKFIGDSSDSIAKMYLIVMTELPDEFHSFTTEEIAEEFFSSEQVVAEMLPQTAEILKYTPTQYDGQPGGLTIFTLVQERAGVELKSYMVQHMFVYRKILITIQCALSTTSHNSSQLVSFSHQYLPKFYQIGNSIVLTDKWSNPIISEALSEKQTSGETSTQYFVLSLILSFILTWGIGLAPPLIIRFVIMKRPLAKSPAIVVAVVFLFLNLLFFVAIGSQSKTHAALLLVAWASYAILRTGHQKESTIVKSETQD